MEMSLSNVALPGPGNLVAWFLETVFCLAPLQRSCVPLVNFISPQGLCKRGMQGGSTLPFQLPHDVSSKLSLLGIKAKETSVVPSSRWCSLPTALLLTSNILHNWSKMDSTAAVPRQYHKEIHLYWMILYLTIYIQWPHSLWRQDIVCPLCNKVESEGVEVEVEWMDM